MIVTKMLMKKDLVQLISELNIGDHAHVALIERLGEFWLVNIDTSSRTKADEIRAFMPSQADEGVI